MQSDRDEQTFELAQGLLSQVQLYMQRRAVDRATAIRELAQVRADDAAVEAASNDDEINPPRNGDTNDASL